MVCWDRCGRTWLACTEHWPQPHQTPLWWIGARPNHPTSVPDLTNARGWMEALVAMFQHLVNSPWRLLQQQRGDQLHINAHEFWMRWSMSRCPHTFGHVVYIAYGLNTNTASLFKLFYLLTFVQRNNVATWHMFFYVFVWEGSVGQKERTQKPSAVWTYTVLGPSMARVRLPEADKLFSHKVLVEFLKIFTWWYVFVSGGDLWLCILYIHKVWDLKRCAPRHKMAKSTWQSNKKIHESEIK